MMFKFRGGPLEFDNLFGWDRRWRATVQQLIDPRNGHFSYL